MNCSVCGHANREQARFCEACAAPLARRCPSCSADLRPQARFCDQCGTAVEGAPAPVPAAAPRRARDYTPRHLAEKILTLRSAIDGERKRVTVLFADMKGSQELAEQVDPEDWHRILDRFFGILTSGIHRFEGTVNQYTGDGVMALFGAPIAHEDHAQRACHAALAVMAELRRFADELRLTRGLNLSMRIGLNSGEVVVGKIGDDLRMDYTAQGHTVGLAARMEQIAEPGRIYLTRHTAALVEGYFRLRDLGEMTVKGAREPLRVYELEGVGALQTRLDLSRARGLSRFIGRERESALLDEALAQVRGGRGQVVGVIGNAGIGKSRLCYEFTERCRAQGVAVHRATGLPYGAALPYYPILALMRSYFGVGENDPPAEVRRKVAGTLLMLDAGLKDALPLVFDFMGVTEARSAATDLPPEVQQARLIEILGVLCRSEGGRPTVILVEDLHWIDPGSESFLARMVELVPDSPTLLLLNYRPEFVADWLTGRLDCEIALSALSAAELSQLTAELLGPGPGLTELGTRICERAGGNPFFVEEAVHALVASGHLQGTTGAYRLLKPVEALAIPDTVQAIIAARIDRLPERDKQVLQHAAVIGREFGRGLLDKVLELPQEALSESLVQLEELGFVNQGTALTNGQYSFCHPLTQQVAYRSQLGEHRARIHAALAADLETGIDPAQPPDERSVLLAHHWECAGVVDKAVQWLLRAAAWSAFRDLSGALARFRRAIELVDQAPVTPLRQQLAVAARAGILRIAAFTPVPDEEVERAYGEAQSIVSATGDQRAQAELLIAYGARRMTLGDARGAFENTRQAVELARAGGAMDLIGRFRLSILMAYFNVGALRAGLQLMEESAGHAWASAAMTAENVGSRAYRANFLMVMGQLGEARRELQTAIEISRQLGRTVSWMHVLLVQTAYFAGSRESAQHDAQNAVRAAEEYDSPFFRLMAYNALGTAHLLHGQWANALEVLERTRPLIEPDQPGRQFAVPHLTGIAEALGGLGRAEEAVQTARAALAAAQEGHMRVWEGRARLQLARALRQACGQEAVTEIADHLTAWQSLVDETGAISYQPFLHEERGHLLLLTGDTAGAQDELARALVLFSQIGAQGQAARLQAEPLRRRA
ncbi:MAG TPA: adenylate/guanylate cyclase domain-containing protein [Nevskiales bacterium]|nr:adenylate/guanylate cyclase domain-containing protein [Nevskiales bacterium]